VGSADLTLGDRVAPVLEALVMASPLRFRGIRHRTAWVENDVMPMPPEWKPGLLGDPDFRRGYSWLSTYGLTFDAFLFHPQIPELTDLARAFPDTKIVLNHLGTPLGIGKYEGKLDEVFQTWKTSIADLATCPNVYMKLGGIGMHVNGFGWAGRERPPTSDELIEDDKDWYLYAIDQFGPDRCMFESNFPVDKDSCSYVVLWNHFKKMTKGFKAEERAAMFHDTALNFYRMRSH
jgi:predicted TIM-barrel fold metal-dependent hydrolase